jgi:predicted PurR-regulated permease PerM
VDIRSISPRAALTAAAIAIALLIAMRFLWVVRTVFIVTFFGVLLGLALSRATDFLERLHLKRAIGAPLVMLAALLLLTALGVMLASPLRTQLRNLSKELPKAIQTLERRVRGTPAQQIFDSAAANQRAAQQTKQQPQSNVSGNSDPSGKAGDSAAGALQNGLLRVLGRELRGLVQYLFPVLSSTFGALAGLVIVIFIAIYIAIAPGLYKQGMLHLVPHPARPRAQEVLETLGVTLRQWLIARLIAMVLIGLITGVGLGLIGVPGALALAVLAGLLELIPFFGPIVAAIPALAIAFTQSPQMGLGVAALYLLVQQIEGNVITPVILKRRLDIPPVLTIVAVSVLGVALGVLGMLLAEPLLAAILVIVKMLYVQDVVGDPVTVGKS